MTNEPGKQDKIMRADIGAHLARHFARLASAGDQPPVSCGANCPGMSVAGASFTSPRRGWLPEPQVERMSWLN